MGCGARSCARKSAGFVLVMRVHIAACGGATAGRLRGAVMRFGRA